MKDSFLMEESIDEDPALREPEEFVLASS